MDGVLFPLLGSFAAYLIQKQILFLHFKDKVPTPYNELKNTYNTAKESFFIA